MKSATAKIEQLYRNNEFKIVVNDEKVLVSEVATSDLGDYIKKLESSEEYKLPFVKPILEKALEIAKRELIKRKNQQMKVYISGPITGFLKDEVITSFSCVETKLKEQGHAPINPLNNGLPWDSSWEYHMKRDIQLLLDCNAIYLLPNYKQSKGAMLELHIAKELGMHVMNEELKEYCLVDAIIEELSRTLEQSFVDYIR